MGQVYAWVRQPTTVAGISALFGTVVALLLKQISLAAAVPLLTGAAMSMVLPDNSAAKLQAEKLAQDVVAQAAETQGAK